MRKTNYWIDDASDPKTPQLDVETYYQIQEIADDCNAAGTKSVIVSECLMYTHQIQCGDEIQQLEQMVDEKLQDYNIDPDVINSLQKQPAAIDPVEIPGDEDKDSKRMRLRIPTEIQASVDWKREWSTKITEAVEHLTESAWEDRSDRIDTKQAIIDYIASGWDEKVVSDTVLRQLLDDPGYYSNGSEIAREIVTEDQWWTNDDLSPSDIKQRQKTKQSLNERESHKRRVAFVNALNYTAQIDNHNIFCRLFDVSEKTAHKHIGILEDDEKYDIHPHDQIEKGVDFEIYRYEHKLCKLRAIEKYAQQNDITISELRKILKKTNTWNIESSHSLVIELEQAEEEYDLDIVDHVKRTERAKESTVL